MTDAAVERPAANETERDTPGEGEAQSSSPPLSRREFLYYLWGASMAVFMAGSGGVTVWFALPRFREGEFGGVFTIPIEEIPTPDSEPKEFPDGRFWLINIGQEALGDERQPDYPLQAGVMLSSKCVCTLVACTNGFPSTIASNALAMVRSIWRLAPASMDRRGGIWINSSWKSLMPTGR